MAGNKAYVVLEPPSAGNPAIDSQPANIIASGVLLAPGNTYIQGINESANFSYGDSRRQIREAVAARIRADFSDPNIDVIFL